MKSKKPIIIVIISILAVIVIAIWAVIIFNVITNDGDYTDNQKDDSSVSTESEENESTGGNVSDTQSNQSDNSISSVVSTPIEPAFVTESYLGGAFVPFDSDALFEKISVLEPGVAEVGYIRVSATGEAEYDYKISCNIIDLVYGTNVKNEIFGLWEYMEYKLVRIDEAEVGKYDVEYYHSDNTIFDQIQTIKGGETHYFAVVAYLPTNVSNAANAKPGYESSFDLEIKILSAQCAE